jgi:hypothetical protein
MNPKAIRIVLFVWIFGLCLVNSRPLRAQVAGGTLSGSITDPSGAALPNAEVVIKNSATGVAKSVTTNSDGFYSAANLLPGEYEVAVSATGFNTGIKKGITINVGSQPVFNLTLQIGTVANTVLVSTEAPTVQLTSSEISATVSATTVRELPLNGRSWTDLAALSPGVDTIRTQTDFSAGSDRGNRGFGQQLTISGARPQQNNYRLDGVSLNDYANGAPGSVLGGNLGVDAIQEFSVLTSNYSAEYGKTSGGVVNAITRSGANAFHGSAYEFLRNSALDARNFFEDPTLPKAGFRRNQFGGAIGGPIIKDRTFFFADYESIRQSKGIPTRDSVPSLNAWKGMLSTGNVTVDSQVAKYQALYLTPPSSCVTDVCAVVFNGQQVISENFVTGRVDHKFSDKDSIFGTYFYDRTPYSAPDGYGNVELGHLTSRQFVAAEETHNFGTSFVNAARFGFNRSFVNDNQSLAGLKSEATDPMIGAGAAGGAFSGRDATYVKVGGLTDMPGGVGGLPTYFYRWNSFQAYDDAFFTKGTHSIKFGVAVERMQSEVIADTDPNGVWTFKDLPTFLTNNPTRFQGGIHSQVAPRNMRQTLVGAYVQDDWRLRPSLTLNLGLRYEMTTVPYETGGKFINLRNMSDPQPVCGVAVTGCAGTGPLFSNPTLRNFEPRIGFAWDALHNGRLAIRGGAGLFDVLPLPYQFTLMETQAAPFFSYTTVTSFKPPPGQNPFPSAGLPATLPPASLRSSFIDSHPKRDYVGQWNLSVQYQLTPNLAAMVAYVGSRGVHLPYRVDEANWILPTLTPEGYIWPPSTAPGTPINGTFASMHGMFYQGRSYYNAFEAQVAKRMSRGFQLQGVFTWAKSMDTSSATVAGDAFQNSISSLDWYAPSLTRGLSDFNVGRTFVLSGTWDAPSPKSVSGVARWPLDGWELGLIFTVSDGVPFTATWGGGNDPASTGSPDGFAYPNRVAGCLNLVNVGNPSNYINTNCFALPTVTAAQYGTLGCDTTFASPVCVNLRGNAGRNTLIGPGLTDLDFSVFKNNYVRRISETFNVQFRAEMFNILNHPNFGPPTPGDGNADIFTSAPSPTGTAIPNPIVGQLVRTTTFERQIQFALKFVF